MTQLDLARPWWTGPLLAFDTETTGPDPLDARIVTAGLAYFADDADTPTWTREVLIAPGVEISAEATAVHGITNERAQADGVPPIVGISEILGQIGSALALGAPVVIFNAPYDATLLREEARRLDLLRPAMIPVVDPLVLDRDLEKFRKGSRKLLDVAARWRVDLKAEEAHGAVADAIAAGRLARTLGRLSASQAMNAFGRGNYALGKWPTDLEGIHKHQERLYELWRVQFNAYQAGPRGKGYLQGPGWPEQVPAA